MKTVKCEFEYTSCPLGELPAEDQALITMATKATERSYAPYSNFRVGAALRLANGEVVLGANQENAAYPVAICAERVALFAASVQHPGTTMDTIAIAAQDKNGLTVSPVTPCGSCRQVMLEMESRSARPLRILLYGTGGVYVIRSAKDLMPLSFTAGTMGL